MREFINRGLTLFFEERGAGVPLLFLHGMGGSHRQVCTTLDDYPGVRLIAPDMQAHGGSGVDWSGYGFAALADDALALADHLGLARFWLGGISLGAAVSLNLAKRHRERLCGLLLVRPAWTDKPMGPDVRWLYSLNADFLAKNDQEGLRNTPEYRELAARSAYTLGALLGNFSDPASLAHPDKFRILPALAPYNMDELTTLAGVPTLVVGCRNDIVHPYEYAEFTARAVPGAALIEIPDRDTDLAGYRQKLNQSIQTFLEAAG